MFIQLCSNFNLKSLTTLQLTFHVVINSKTVIARHILNESTISAAQTCQFYGLLFAIFLNFSDLA